MEVIVEDKQLSLAIGKKGQNVRLAAKLTGWRIDIKSEEEKRREVEAQFGELEIPGESADEGALSAEGDAEGATAEEAGEASEAGATEAPLPYTLAGIGEKTIRKLVEGGFATLESLGSATAEVAVGAAGHRREDRREDPGGGRGRSPTRPTRQAKSNQRYRVWQLSGYSRSRNCSAPRARK